MRIAVNTHLRRRPARAAMNQELSSKKAPKCSSLSNWGSGGEINRGGSGVNIPQSTTANNSHPAASHSRRFTAIPSILFASGFINVSIAKPCVRNRELIGDEPENSRWVTDAFKRWDRVADRCELS